MGDNKTVFQQINEVIHKMCSDYCKYGNSDMTGEEFDEVCGRQCPLKKLYGGETLD